MGQDDRDIPDGQSANAAADDYGAVLRAYEQRFTREFGCAPYGMIMAGLSAGRPGICLVVNDAYCELTGYSRQELSGHDFLGDFHPEEQPAIEELVRSVTSGATGQFRIEARLVRQDGDISFVRLTGSVMRPPGAGRYLAIYVTDATAIEQARAEIRQLELELHRSRRLESVGHLVGGMAHDFNNLLTVIANYASLVREEVSAAEVAESTTRWEPVRWDVEQIESAADRAKKLISQVLATARREQAPPGVVDLGQLVSDVSRLLGRVLGEHVPVVTRQAAGLWPVEADPGLLEQAIINILVNARDAMPSGGQITIQTANIDTAVPAIAGQAIDRQDAANIAELLPGRYVELRISDIGTGMDEATTRQAFEPFFTTKAGDQAAGLGLSAVRMLATQAGGRAWLRSEPGAGTTVTVMLPAAAGSGSEAAGSSGPHQGPAEQPRAIIVVDDEAAIRDVTHRVLGSAGYQVTTAPDGQQALDLLRDPSAPADLVLADVVMPGLAGQALASQIQAVRPGIPVLFMSGYERPDAIGGSWPDPGTTIIAKPFSRAALLTRIAQAITVGIGADSGAR